jgi:hypothetical protein
MPRFDGAPYDLIGGFATQLGPLPNPAVLNNEDHETLARLGLRPVFIGVEREIIEGVINGNMNLLDQLSRRPTTVGGPDPSGTWSIRLGEDEAELYQHS